MTQSRRVPIRSVLAIAETDSRLLWCSRIAKRFAAVGARVDYVLHRNKRNPIAQQQQRIVGKPALPVLTLEQAVDRALSGTYDVVLLGAANKTQMRFRRCLKARIDEENAQRRPVLVTGFWGIVYEGGQESIMARQGCDIVCLNSPNDRTIFANVLDDEGLDPGCLIVTGLSGLGKPGLPSPVRPPRRILFAGQTSVPAKYGEREYLLRRLIEWAEARPDADFTIAPRIRPGEPSTHDERLALSTVMDAGGLTPPRNLHFAYGLIKNFIRHSDMLVTVGSTAALEALWLGLPVAILGDFGLREDYGTHFFIGSGLVTSFDELIAGHVPTPNPAWVHRQGLDPQMQREDVVAKAAALLAQQAESGQPLPWRPDPAVEGRFARYAIYSISHPVTPFHKRIVNLALRRVAGLVVRRQPRAAPSIEASSFTGR
jgi:hypothetical protein